MLVGKGIVYDTGGLSIKDKFGMPGMKRDMGGAAAVLGAFLYEVDMGFSENLACILCLGNLVVSPFDRSLHFLFSLRKTEKESCMNDSLWLFRV